MKATIQQITFNSHIAETASSYYKGIVYYYNQRIEVTATGYDKEKDIEFTLTMKLPANHDMIPKCGNKLDVSVSFDEHVSTIKTTQLI